MLSSSPVVPFIDAAHAQDARAPDAPLVEGNATMELENGGVSGLPFARGKAFACLDDYLTHLETLGAIDLPWWREVRPGVYERVVRMPEREREVATREELLRRFGFSC
jgi:hypothetical protein